MIKTVKKIFCKHKFFFNDLIKSTTFKTFKRLKSIINESHFSFFVVKRDYDIFKYQVYDSINSFNVQCIFYSFIKFEDYNDYSLYINFYFNDVNVMNMSELNKVIKI